MMTTANRAAAWSWIEDKIFEDALVKFPEGVVNRWRRIAQCLPGKSLDDVIAHYEALLYDVGQIDSGRVELPSYSDEREERFGLMGTGRNSFGSLGGNVKRTQCERKKGKPWTVEEHRFFVILFVSSIYLLEFLLYMDLLYGSKWNFLVIIIIVFLESWSSLFWKEKNCFTDVVSNILVFGFSSGRFSGFLWRSILDFLSHDVNCMISWL